MLCLPREARKHSQTPIISGQQEQQPNISMFPFSWNLRNKPALFRKYNIQINCCFPYVKKVTDLQDVWQTGCEPRGRGWAALCLTQERGLKSQAERGKRCGLWSPVSAPHRAIPLFNPALCQSRYLPTRNLGKACGDVPGLLQSLTCPRFELVTLTNFIQSLDILREQSAHFINPANFRSAYAVF